MREVYVDESSQVAHHYMVLGSMTLSGTTVSAAQAALYAVLERHNTFGEIKWTKISGAKYALYRELVIAHFQLVRDLGIQFDALIVDCHGLDHRTYNAGDAELGFNKFLFQLLHHKVCRRFGENEKIVVYLDSRTAARDPEELQVVLNRKATKEFGDPRSPFSRIVFRDSKSSRLLQLVDLLIGAVAWHKNDQDTRPEASKHKTALANEIAGHIGRGRLGGNTQHLGLNVWNFQLRPRRRGAR